MKTISPLAPKGVTTRCKHEPTIIVKEAFDIHEVIEVRCKKCKKII
jgi:hypothetical protein